MTKVTRPMKPIPISAASKIAKTYGYDQVIIYTRRVGEIPEPHGEHMVTFGVNQQHCDAAILIGEALRKFMGWKVEDTTEHG